MFASNTFIWRFLCSHALDFALSFNKWSAYSRIIVFFFLQEFYTLWALNYLKIALSNYGKALIFGWITYSLWTVQLAFCRMTRSVVDNSEASLLCLPLLGNALFSSLGSLGTILRPPHNLKITTLCTWLQFPSLWFSWEHSVLFLFSLLYIPTFWEVTAVVTISRCNSFPYFLLVLFWSFLWNPEHRSLKSSFHISESISC